MKTVNVKLTLEVEDRIDPATLERGIAMVLKCELGMELDAITHTVKVEVEKNDS